MDLWKAYDCISHELFIAKLDSYGVTKYSLITSADVGKVQRLIHQSVHGMI